MHGHCKTRLSIGLPSFLCSNNYFLSFYRPFFQRAKQTLSFNETSINEMEFQKA